MKKCSQCDDTGIKGKFIIEKVNKKLDPVISYLLFPIGKVFVTQITYCNCSIGIKKKNKKTHGTK